MHPPITPLKYAASSSSAEDPLARSDRNDSGSETYEFDAPKFYDFTRELLRQVSPNNMPLVDANVREMRLLRDASRPSSSRKTRTRMDLVPQRQQDEECDADQEDGLFAEEQSWFDNNRYLVKSPDGMPAYIPVKPTRIADDAEVAGTPFGKFCLQQSAERYRIVGASMLCRAECNSPLSASRRSSVRNTSAPSVSLSTANSTPVARRASSSTVHLAKSPLCIATNEDDIAASNAAGDDVDMEPTPLRLPSSSPWTQTPVVHARNAEATPLPRSPSIEAEPPMHVGTPHRRSDPRVGGSSTLTTPKSKPPTPARQVAGSPTAGRQGTSPTSIAQSSSQASPASSSPTINSLSPRRPSTSGLAKHTSSPDDLNVAGPAPGTPSGNASSAAETPVACARPTVLATESSSAQSPSVASLAAKTPSVEKSPAAAGSSKAATYEHRSGAADLMPLKNYAASTACRVDCTGAGADGPLASPLVDFKQSPLASAGRAEASPKGKTPIRGSKTAFVVEQAAASSMVSPVPQRSDMAVTLIGHTSPAPKPSSPKHILDLADAIDRLAKPSSGSDMRVSAAARAPSSPLKKTMHAATSALLPVRSVKPLTVPQEFAFSAKRPSTLRVAPAAHAGNAKPRVRTPL